MIIYDSIADVEKYRMMKDLIDILNKKDDKKLNKNLICFIKSLNYRINKVIKSNLDNETKVDIIKLYKNEFLNRIDRFYSGQEYTSFLKNYIHAFCNENSFYLKLPKYTELSNNKIKILNKLKDDIELSDKDKSLISKSKEEYNRNGYYYFTKDIRFKI